MMKKAGFLTLFLLLALITQAAKVDDFQSYGVGTIASGVTGGSWTELTAGTSFARISEDAGNQFLQVGYNAGGRGAWRSIPPVVNTASATTLFLRLYVTSSSQDASFGLSDVAAPTAVDWGNFEMQMVLGNGDDTSHVNLRARDGGTVETYAALELNQWYNIWAVIDQTTDSYDMYLSTDLAPAIGTAPINPDPINFRNGTTADLTTFLNLVNYRDMNFRIDHIHLTGGVDLTNPMASEPYNPNPQQTPNAPKMDVLLNWNAGADVTGVNAVNPDIVNEYLFMTDGSADPNLYYIGATNVDPGLTEPASQYGPLSLQPGQTYSWAVVEAIDGYEQEFTAGSTLEDVDGDPNNIIGVVWSFTTDLLVPDFTVNPADQIVFPGETAEFTVVLKDDNASYQWYKDAAPLSGAVSATLTIPNAQDADEGIYYCLATNTSGSTESLTAQLQIKRLRSYYPMETAGVVDGSSITPDTVGGYPMTLLQEGTAGIPTLDPTVINASLGTYSLRLDNGDHAADPNGQYAQIDPGVVDYEDITVTAWVYWNGGANWQRLFDFGNDTSHYMFLTPGNGSQCRFVLNNGGGEQIVSTAPLASGEWVFVAVTLGGDTGRIYINGEPRAANTAVTINPADFAPAVNYIGKSQYPADAEFDGWIDELKIYNYELSAEMIAGEYYDGTGLEACFNPDFAGNAYNLDNTGSSYCKVDLADFAVLAVNWLADGLWTAP